MQKAADDKKIKDAVTKQAVKVEKKEDNKEAKKAVKKAPAAAAKKVAKKAPVVDDGSDSEKPSKATK